MERQAGDGAVRVGGNDMSKLGDTVQSLRTFFADVAMEAKKSSWPDRDELLSSTAVVIVSALIISGFVGVSDFILHRLLRWLLS
jgi:preprotein translocase subunit SecE